MKTGNALIGVRSLSTLCSPDPDIDCLNNADRCTQCAMIFEAEIDTSSQQATIDSVDDIFEENLPVTFTTVDQLVNGVDANPLDADPTVHGLIQSITIQPSENINR